MNPRLFSPIPYFFQKIDLTSKKLLRKYLSLIYDILDQFYDFHKENKLFKKFNFTYWVLILAIKLVFFLYIVFITF